ncbi:MAG: AraC family transcriptional regulator [Clostridia bacterium]|nr:AraC family transcriptional regulator [Clostridia bacterium]
MDLSITNSGREDCAPRHSYGPAVRSCYLFHYISAGRGVFEIGERRYELHAGQGFLIVPDIVTRYQADDTDPWHYSWLGFRGADAEMLIARTGLSAAQPIFEAGPISEITACMHQIYDDMHTMPDAALGTLAAAGGALRFIALISGTRRANLHAADAYYEKGMWYIRAHMERTVTVEEIAAFVGLSRSQLFRAFRQSAGVSPREALAQARAEQARRLLRSGDLPLYQIAAACGYANAAHFSAAFRRSSGMSPLEYRQQAVF